MKKLLHGAVGLRGILASFHLLLKTRGGELLLKSKKNLGKVK